MDLLANLWLGFSVAVTPTNLLFCLIGALVGTLIGVTATPIPSQRLEIRSYMVVLADYQNRGQSWNGRFKP